MSSVVRYQNTGEARGLAQGPRPRLPASHQQYGLNNISQAFTVQLWTSWAVNNSSSGDLLVGPRLKLIRVRGFGFPDETWVEFAPGEGVFTDKLKQDVGISSAVGPTTPISIPPGQHDPEWLMFLPAPASSSVARSYWEQFDDAKFNFEVELWQVPFIGATRDDSVAIASHVYKDVFQVDVDAVPLQALQSASNGIQPRLTVQLS